MKSDVLKGAKKIIVDIGKFSCFFMIGRVIIISFRQFILSLLISNEKKC
jgi:hypothetical protein